MTHLSVLWVYPFQKYQISSSWHFLSWIFFWEIRHALGRLAKLTVQTFAISDNSLLWEFKSSAKIITKVLIYRRPWSIDARLNLFIRIIQWAEIYHKLWKPHLFLKKMKIFAPLHWAGTRRRRADYILALKKQQANNYFLQETSHPIVSCSGSIYPSVVCSE